MLHLQTLKHCLTTGQVAKGNTMHITTKQQVKNSKPWPIPQKKESERQRKLGPQVCHLTSVQFQCFGTCDFIILYVSSTTLIRHWGKHTCYMSQDSIKIIIFLGGFQLALAEAREGKISWTPRDGWMGPVQVQTMNRRRRVFERCHGKFNYSIQHVVLCFAMADSFGTGRSGWRQTWFFWSSQATSIQRSFSFQCWASNMLVASSWICRHLALQIPCFRI